MALFGKNFSVYSAEQFKEAFSETASTNMYAFIGKHTDWPSEPTPTPTDENVDETEFEFWRTMLAAKRVQTSDVAHAIPRYDWTSGKVYREYDSTSNTLYSTPESANTFYVFTEDNRVYKCLFNNKGVPSTVKPTTTAVAPQTTSDGYVWKYMYNVTGAEYLKFVTDDYMIVKADDIVETGAQDGIDIIDVRDGGSNYITDSGTVAGVTSTTITLSSSAEGVDDIYNGSSVYISSGRGVSQIRKITDYVGVTKVATLESAWTITPNTSSEYLVSPTVEIDGDGVDASFYANVASGSINYINKIAAGSGYTRATINITGGQGSGANAVAYIAPPGGHGKDPIYELGGSNIILNYEFVNSEAGVFPYTEFRQYGLIANPLLVDTETVASGPAYNQTLRLGVGSVTGLGQFTYGETITGGTSGASGIFVSFANTNSANTAGTISLANTDGTFIASDVLTGSTSGLAAEVANITKGELEPFSGKLLYKENRTFIQRQTNQTEDVKLVVRF